MKKFVTYGLWACFYVICVCLGMVGMPQDFGVVLRIIMALGFFVPPLLLLIWARQEQDAKTLKRLRILSLCSLGLTMVLLTVNLVSFAMSELMGRILYVALVLVSAPMTCLGHWVLSMFLWACLLMATWVKFPGREK